MGITFHKKIAKPKTDEEKVGLGKDLYPSVSYCLKALQVHGLGLEKAETAHVANELSKVYLTFNLIETKAEMINTLMALSDYCVSIHK